MTLISKATEFFISCISMQKFYSAFNYTYKTLFNEFFMLHYPLYVNKDDDFTQSQKNLSDHCISKLSPIQDKKVLDIGCGNGIQGIYIFSKYNPSKYVGIDISTENINIANNKKEERNISNILFYVDDAQKLSHIDDNSFDVVISIESALHYPEKVKFLKEIHRVLKQAGEFLIADILTREKSGTNSNTEKKKWGIYYHWTLSLYRKSFPLAKLDLTYSQNITDLIIKGFQNYKNWFKYRTETGVVKQIFAKLIVLINAKVHIHLFKKSRQYYIFSGTKK